MNVFYVIGSLVAVALLIYLVMALVRAEDL
ncbi:K(+)-transporting ATPase subunit F [Herminiimonas fonticola]